MGRKKLGRGRKTVIFDLTENQKIEMNQFVVMNQEALRSAGVRPTSGIFSRASARWFMRHVKNLPRLKGYGKIEGRK
jgi:hypothetical protein